MKIRLKWAKSSENQKKILTKSEKNLKKIVRLDFQNAVLLLGKNRYFVIIEFKTVKMEEKVSHCSYFCKSSENFKKISGSISGKAKKIEVQEK